jgi:hypothetical protein
MALRRRRARWAAYGMGLLLAQSAWGQATSPSVEAFPLEVKRAPPQFSAKDIDELQKEFVRLIRRSGAMVPDTATHEKALRDLKRQDCDREDECLRQLAQRSSSLYAVYAQVDLNIEGTVVVSGRIVRDDGQVEVPVQTMTFPMGHDTFKDVARVGLGRLIDKMRVGKLSSVRPASRPSALDESSLSAPPLVVREGGPTPMRIASFGMLGLGGAGLITGLALIASAQSDISTLDVNRDGNIAGSPSQAQVSLSNGASTKTGVGSALLATGVALAGAGAVLLVLDLKRVTPVAAVTPDGATFAIVGRWP